MNYETIWTWRWHYEPSSLWTVVDYEIGILWTVATMNWEYTDRMAKVKMANKKQNKNDSPLWLLTYILKKTNSPLWVLFHHFEFRHSDVESNWAGHYELSGKLFLISIQWCYYLSIYDLHISNFLRAKIRLAWLYIVCVAIVYGYSSWWWLLQYEVC
jgi:hypothetical protein